VSGPIESFAGEFRWLSNFEPVSVTLDGVEYPSTEHAYQAAKTTDPAERKTVRACETPGRAKRAGRKLTMRHGFDGMKVAVMLDLTRQKYTDPELRERLLATGEREIVEGNTWGDTFWGVCRGEGRNHLGRILMRVRREIRESPGMTPE
jgi:ribA/ribD-fused uncharacterized protein